MLRIFRGSIVHSRSLHELEVLESGWLGVDTSGRVAFLERSRADVPGWAWAKQHEVVELGRRLLVPGLVDTHTHAPQYVNAGTGRIPLLQWLERYTFPAESRFRDPAYARLVYPRAVARSLRNGTTTCAYYATIHTEASLVLCDVARRAGQRAFVGKVCMDQNCPDHYREGTDESVEQTEKFVEEALRAGGGGGGGGAAATADALVRPIITPRFAPTCSAALMRRLAAVADRHQLMVQTHISENADEIRWVRELFPECGGYADVYARCGLLHERAVMGHAIHLTEDEKRLFAERRVGVAHCPNSNFSIDSGTLDVRDLLRRNIKVGLGTDVSGGYSSSVLDAARQAIIAARSLDFDARRRRQQPARPRQPDEELQQPGGEDKTDDAELGVAEAFFLATMGGADVLNLGGRVGNFVPGKEFDALVVDCDAAGSPIDTFPSDGPTDLFNKFFFLGDDRNIVRIFVAGREVQLQSLPGGGGPADGTVPLQ